ncbi:DSD1 family PLP-dependent enzyme [Henriciella mobilis]|uniref:alanine racemase n=1 Tax=Henriciella mobilis TaxID=2305467 RepID=UPI000E6744B3|nr:alanine racemase [Henriciella mobilis]RIJ16783.1 DSD1 family PLP-dependent enzyme [Henriciella mobilis]RIJ19472.1 DSD1 family PLP-dependent enzyme [Henriciella mobilis]
MAAPALDANYFAALSKALKEAGIAQPTLVIDRQRLDHNIETLLDDLPEGMGYRIVAKSLPSVGLIRHIRTRTGSDRLMTFNIEMLLALAGEMPEAEQLLGKPMPVAAARRFYSEASPDANIKWLVDTPTRAEQYLALAAELGITMQLVLEVDVGLHRGGFAPDDALVNTVRSIDRSNHAAFAGLMGYEPHVAKMPEKGGLREVALQSAWSIFSKAQAMTCASRTASGLILNAAGSPTYRLYRDTEIANEVSVGSVLVKPTDFDTPLLAPHWPASFIATPALKVLDGINIAGFEFVRGRQPDLPEGHDKTVFIFGGNWMAEPVWPESVVLNDTYGRSSNQQMLTAPSTTPIEPDEYVFLRPKQSESVFLQFGDIAVFENGCIAERWPVFHASA